MPGNRLERSQSHVKGSCNCDLLKSVIGRRELGLSYGVSLGALAHKLVWHQELPWKRKPKGKWKKKKKGYVRQKH